MQKWEVISSQGGEPPGRAGGLIRVADLFEKPRDPSQGHRLRLRGPGPNAAWPNSCSPKDQISKAPGECGD